MPQATKPTWDEVMSAIGSGRFGDPIEVRQAATGVLERDAEREGEPGVHGISSSDINHTMFAIVGRAMQDGVADAEVLKYMENW